MIRALGVGAVAASMVCATAALAQVEQSDSISAAAGDVTEGELEAFRNAVRDLASNDWLTRENAAATLRDSPVENAAFEEMIYITPRETEQLTAEQRHRLITILAERLLTIEAGAIGIRMSTTFDAGGIYVSQVFVNMPSAGILQEGDRITHLNGELVRDAGDFSSRMRRLRSGEEITLRFERLREGPRTVIDWNNPDPGNVEVHQADMTLKPAEMLGDRHMEDLQQRRQIEVAELYRRVPVASIDLRVPSRFDSPQDHATIVQVRRELEWYRDLDEDDRRLLGRTWKARYDTLRAWYDERGLSLEERRYRRDVLNVFLDLIPEEVLREW